MSKVVLGFSGGVDSAVTSVLLKKEGHEVHGLYLDNAGKDALDDAVKTAEFVGIPIDVIDVKAELEQKVCSFFEKSYLKGETPNPCIICNPSLKFRNLCAYADKIDAPFISTGHYAVSKGGGLYKGNPENDQSYMLCRILPSQLERLILPLGDYPKSEVRLMAKEFNLPVASKPDSMEICFIPDKDYISWLSNRVALPGSGDLVLHGEVVGQHKGIHCYTVGQRYPGLMNERKIYISKIDAENNVIVLSYWEELFKKEVYAKDFNYLMDMPETFDASVRVRHTKWEEPGCKVSKCKSGVIISCLDDVRAPSNGQSAVLYQGKRVIGGGIICDSTNI